MDVLAGGNEAAKLAFPGVTPNPVRGAEGRFEFVMQEPGPVKLALYDVRGRLARTVTDGTFGSGRQSVAWNGRGDNSSVLGPGVCWARLGGRGSHVLDADGGRRVTRSMNERPGATGLRGARRATLACRRYGPRRRSRVPLR